MSLLVILVSLLIERFLGSVEEMRRFGWFGRWVGRLRDWLPSDSFWDGAPGVVVAVGLPLSVVALASHGIGQFWLLIGFLFGVVVLLYCLGPRDLEAEIEAFVDARRRGDEESARWYAERLLGEEPPENAAQMMRAIREVILVEAHERLLGVMFWFVVLGPVGAVLYRLSVELVTLSRGVEGEFAAAARRLHYILAWPSVRLCALGYAVGGSFVDAMQGWQDKAERWEDHNRGILVASGLGALQCELEGCGEAIPTPESGDTDPATVDATLALVRRAVLVWLALLALLTLAGWAG